LRWPFTKSNEAYVRLAPFVVSAKSYCFCFMPSSFMAVSGARLRADRGFSQALGSGMWSRLKCANQRRGLVHLMDIAALGEEAYFSDIRAGTGSAAFARTRIMILRRRAWQEERGEDNQLLRQPEQFNINLKIEK